MTVIAPLDFSSQSINAAAFAANMLAGTYEAELVLYHLYVQEGEEAEVLRNLRKVKSALQQSCSVNIRCVAEKGVGLVASLSHLVNKEDAGLVVMSVSDRVKFFEDSYSLQMMAQSLCPVLVIPYGYLYNEVKTVALACDFKSVNKIIPAAKVKKVLDLFHAKLHIVHINPEIHVSISDELKAERRKLEEMFAAYQPEFSFLTLGDFAQGIEAFIEDNDIDLVLTFPRRHGFLSSPLKGSNTQKLVYKNSVPVLAAHE